MGMTRRAVQYHRMVWSEQSQSGRTDLVQRQKMRNELLGRRKKQCSSRWDRSRVVWLRKNAFIVQRAATYFTWLRCCEIFSDDSLQNHWLVCDVIAILATKANTSWNFTCVLLFIKVSGLKDLVLDAELMKPLDRVAGASLLKVLSLVFSWMYHSQSWASVLCIWQF